MKQALLSFLDALKAWIWFHIFHQQNHLSFSQTYAYLQITGILKWAPWLAGLVLCSASALPKLSCWAPAFWSVFGCTGCMIFGESQKIRRMHMWRICLTNQCGNNLRSLVNCMFELVLRASKFYGLSARDSAGKRWGSTFKRHRSNIDQHRFICQCKDHDKWKEQFGKFKYQKFSSYSGMNFWKEGSIAQGFIVMLSNQVLGACFTDDGLPSAKKHLI